MSSWTLLIAMLEIMPDNLAHYHAGKKALLSIMLDDLADYHAGRC